MHLDLMDEDLMEDDTSDECEDQVDWEPQGHVVYSSISSLALAWTACKPISVVISKADGGYHAYYCCVKVDGRKCAVEFGLNDDGEVSKYFFGLHYHQFEMLDNRDLMEWDEINISQYGLLLPLDLRAPDMSQQWHSVITSKWKCISESGRKVKPHQYLAELELEDWGGELGFRA